MEDEEAGLKNLPPYSKEMSFQEMANAMLVQAIATFGETVAYQSASAGSASIKAVFDRMFVEVKSGANVGVGSVHPTLGVRLADLPATPDVGDEATVRGVSYRVIESQEDGQGGAMLILHEL